MLSFSLVLFATYVLGVFFFVCVLLVFYLAIYRPLSPSSSGAPSGKSGGKFVVGVSGTVLFLVHMNPFFLLRCTFFSFT